MRTLIRTAVLALGLLPGFAHAQSSSFPQTLPPNTLVGRLGISAGPAQAIPFATFFANQPLAAGKVWIGSAGNLAAPQTPSGDLAVSTAGAFTLASVNVTTGVFGSATQCVTVTTNAKGLTTGISAATCAPAVGSISGLGTAIATALGVNVGTAGSVVVNGGALGTPSSGTLTSATGLPISTGLTGAGTGILAALAINTGSAGAPVLFNGAGGTPTSIALTNATGTAASLTSGHVTTNANLTGDVTSVGNASTLAAGNAGNLNSGTLLAARMPALTGDCTTSAGAVATTCTKINGVDQTTAWTTYTPGTTCNTGSGTWTTNTAKSKQLGKTVHWQIDVTLSTVGTCANATWKFNLPSTPVSGGGGSGAETATSGASVTCGYSGGSAVASCNIAGTNLTLNARYVASGVYEGP